MSRTYYTLVTLDDNDGYWKPQFGDYNRETVEYERDDYKDNGYSSRELKIIRTGDKQADINEAVTKLNA